jgi:hypothetical protein
MFKPKHFFGTFLSIKIRAVVKDDHMLEHPEGY